MAPKNILTLGCKTGTENILAIVAKWAPKISSPWLQNWHRKYPRPVKPKTGF